MEAKAVKILALALVLAVGCESNGTDRSSEAQDGDEKQVKSSQADQTSSWPDQVVVDHNLRLTSMPERIGTYRFVPGSDKVFGRDILAALGLGGYGSDQAHAERRSGWYVVRSYQQSSADQDSTTDPLTVSIVYWPRCPEVPHSLHHSILATGARALQEETAQLAFSDSYANAEEIVPVQILRYRMDQSQDNEVAMISANMFILDGQAIAEAASVRRKALLEGQPYLCRIIVSYPEGDELPKSRTAILRFLRALLPELMHLLPDPA